MGLFSGFLFINSSKRFWVRELRSNMAEPKYPAFDHPITDYSILSDRVNVSRLRGDGT